MNQRILLAAAGLLFVTGAVIWRARLEPAGEQAAAPEGDDLVREERAAREALRDHPDDPQAHLRLARALRKLGSGSEADAQLLQAIRLGLPEAEGQREYVLLMAARNWPPKLEGLFQRVVREHPGDQELLAAVADSYFAKGWWLKAEPLYTQLLAQDPGQVEWRFKRGVTSMKRALHARAADDFRGVLSSDPSRYEARLFLAHSLLGDARMAEAERELLACHKERPNDPEPLVGLAACESERNNLGAAEEFLRRAAELADGSALVLQEQATLYLRQQRTELAIATLERLVALHPDHRQGHLQLSQAYLIAGNATEARRHEAIYKELDQKEEARLAAQRGMH